MVQRKNSVVGAIIEMRQKGIKREVVTLSKSGPVAYLECICTKCHNYLTCSHVVNHDGIPYSKDAKREFIPEMERLPQAPEECISYAPKSC